MKNYILLFAARRRGSHSDRIAMIKIIPRLATFAAGIALAASPSALRPSFAQDHSQMHHEDGAKPAKKKVKVKSKNRTQQTMVTEHGNVSSIDHTRGHGSHEMQGFLGPYGM